MDAGPGQPSPVDPKAAAEKRRLDETLPASGVGASSAQAIPAIRAPQIEGYEILGRLGEGGMGVVWRAVQRSTHRQVALKTMSAASFASDRARLRFQRELDLSARLEHPNVARIYEGGEKAGVRYYAMELIEGDHLDQYV